MGQSPRSLRLSRSYQEIRSLPCPKGNWWFLSPQSGHGQYELHSGPTCMVQRDWTAPIALAQHQGRWRFIQSSSSGGHLDPCLSFMSIALSVLVSTTTQHVTRPQWVRWSVIHLYSLECEGLTPIDVSLFTLLHTYYVLISASCWAFFLSSHLHQHHSFSKLHSTTKTLLYLDRCLCQTILQSHPIFFKPTPTCSTRTVTTRLPFIPWHYLVVSCTNHILNSYLQVLD